MPPLGPTFVLDLIATVAAFFAAFLWFLASARQVRRVSKNEVLDEHDINRIVVAYNRSQILSGRAALATAVSALAVALRFVVAWLVAS